MDFLPSPEEYEVAEILLEQLPFPVWFSEPPLGSLPLTWPKRRRSIRNLKPSGLLLRSSSPSSSFHQGSADPVSPPHEIGGSPPLKVNATSPDTPLSFSPSESYEKPKHLKKEVSLGKKKEEWLGRLNELTERRDSLKVEIQNVKRYYDKLTAVNSRLKEMKQKLNVGLVTELAPPQPTVKLFVEPDNEDEEHHHHQPIPGLPHHHHQPAQVPFPLITNNVGPVVEGSAELMSSQQFDMELAKRNLNKAIAAEARQRRIQIYRVKKLCCR